MSHRDLASDFEPGTIKQLIAASDQDIALRHGETEISAKLSAIVQRLTCAP